MKVITKNQIEKLSQENPDNILGKKLLYFCKIDVDGLHILSQLACSVSKFTESKDDESYIGDLAILSHPSSLYVIVPDVRFVIIELSGFKFDYDTKTLYQSEDESSFHLVEYQYAEVISRELESSLTKIIEDYNQNHRPKIPGIRKSNLKLVVNNS